MADTSVWLRTQCKCFHLLLFCFIYCHWNFRFITSMSIFFIIFFCKLQPAILLMLTLKGRQRFFKRYFFKKPHFVCLFYKGGYLEDMGKSITFIIYNFWNTAESFTFLSQTISVPSRYHSLSHSFLGYIIKVEIVILCKCFLTWEVSKLDLYNFFLKPEAWSIPVGEGLLQNNWNAQNTFPKHKTVSHLISKSITFLCFSMDLKDVLHHHFGGASHPESLNCRRKML